MSYLRRLRDITNGAELIWGSISYPDQPQYDLKSAEVRGLIANVPTHSPLIFLIAQGSLVTLAFLLIVFSATLILLQ